MGNALEIRQPSANELLFISNSSVLRLLFPIMVSSEPNFPILAALLKNRMMNVQKTYDASCASWSELTVRRAIRWVKRLPEYAPEIHMIFSAGCVENIQASGHVMAELRKHRILTGIPNDLKLIKEKELSKLLSSSWAIYKLDEWCEVLPAKMRVKDKLNTIDLPRAITFACLHDNYVGKPTIIQSTLDQIPQAFHGSNSQLILTLGSISSSNSYGQQLYAKLRARYCNPGTSGSKRAHLNALALRCNWLTEDLNINIRKVLKFLTKWTLSDPKLVLLIRLVLLVSKPKPVIDALTLRGQHVTRVDIGQLLELTNDLILAPLKLRRTFMKAMGLDYDEIVMFGSKWYPNATCAYMSWEWRLADYRRRFMKVPKSTSVSWTPLVHWYGPNVGHDTVWRRLHNFIFGRPQIAIQYGTPTLIRPRVMPIKVRLLKVIFNWMVYGLVRFGKPVMLLDPIYCQFIAGTNVKVPKGDYTTYTQIRKQKSMSSSQFTKHVKNFRKQQMGLLTDLLLDWKLYYLIDRNGVCGFLSDAQIGEGQS